MIVGPTKLIGAKVKRVEDPRLLTGRGRFIDDISLPGMVEVAFVRSPHAHAKICAIRTEEALQSPGVLAILTGEEAARLARPLQAKLHEAPGLERLARSYKIASWYPLAYERVRYVGEAVVALVAENRYLAEDAAQKVSVDYEPLPVVADVEKALEIGAPLLYAEWGDNIMLKADFRGGDPERAFREASVVVRDTFRTNRCTGLSIETRGGIAKYDPASQTLTLWTSSQIPHVVRMTAAQLIGMPENKLQVIAPDIGGGFGIKSHVFPEEIVLCLLARQVDRPVKWIEDRSENLQSAIHARQGVFTIELAASADGTILGMRAKLISDAGAYPAYPGTSNEPLHMSVVLPGPYRISNYEYEMLNVVTNKSPLGPYRAVGAPMATYVVEYLVDCLARNLRMDPAEVRKKNLIQREEFPYTTATGLVYDSGSYIEALEKALEMVDYKKFRQEQGGLRGQGRYLGVGIACYVEITAPGSMFYAIWDASGFDTVTVRLTPNGKVIVETGMSCPGQGYETTLAQIVGDEFGVGLDDVTVLMGDTASTPFSWGSHSSRFTVVCGGAASLAARQVKEKLFNVAARYFATTPERIEIRNGQVAVKCSPGKELPLADVCKLAMVRPDRVPGGVPVALEATQSYEPPPLTTPNATHVAIVEADPETGQIQILRYVVAHDCGKMINPMIVEGQIRGGTAQGIGNALYEDLVYGEDGQLLTGSLMDYMVPTAVEVPLIEIAHLETPSSLTPGGVKGMGEGGAIAPPGAIANAVADALSPFGVKVTELPISPERLWRQIQQARKEDRTKYQAASDS
jgi:carbon-monoxide dehydrogenase large subunit